MRFNIFLVVIFQIIFLSACSPLSLVNLTSPSGHYEKNSDVAYGEENRQKLDIYTPKEVSSQQDENKVLVIFFYGGSWDSGSKEKYKFVASRLTQLGYKVVIPDYRIYPEVTYPSFVEDAALAVAWLQNNKKMESIERVYLMGHSAGAQIAGLLASNEEYLKNAGVNSEYISGFIGLAGPYNFLPLRSNKLKIIFPEKIRSSSQPIHYIEGNEVPFLLLHGRNDGIVVPENSISLADKITQKNGDVTLRLYDETGHVKIMKPFIGGQDATTQTLQDIQQFIGPHK
jgi:acetyl esterase/lipase